MPDCELVLRCVKLDSSENFEGLHGEFCRMRKTSAIVHCSGALSHGRPAATRAKADKKSTKKARRMNMAGTQFILTLLDAVDGKRVVKSQRFCAVLAGTAHISAVGTNSIATSVRKVRNQRAHSSIPACSEAMCPSRISAFARPSVYASVTYSTVSHSCVSPAIKTCTSGISSAPVSR